MIISDEGKEKSMTLELLGWILFVFLSIAGIFNYFLHSQSFIVTDSRLKKSKKRGGER
ncbi:MAG: hypothetical protein JW867_07860 [Candidatus Omnitrophica bacterium]|nr:hypothetical protein [Candidatus Omnitrophota bacterium]